MKRIIFSLLGFFILFTGIAQAQSATTSCSNRYLTLINPVRSRSLWKDKSLKPLTDQYNLVKRYSFSATWLVQDDVFSDKVLLSKIKQFNKKQEIGLFLEVSGNLATSTDVIYPANTPWYKPNAVFLSGYGQNDRKRLIDRMFSDFKNKFGYFPKSVGAWWIDSFSLNYIKNKYGVSTVMIVTDQKTTDNYGVWGQWWSVPYYPSKENVLTPAQNSSDKLGPVVIQWAQRDPDLSYGTGAAFSNYSLQANDYISQGKDTSYFASLVNSYLDCQNKVGQITIGLETGIESVGFIKEYANQLSYLHKLTNLKSATMSQFYDQYKSVYSNNPSSVTISKNDSHWQMTPRQRVNAKFNETVNYSDTNIFPDTFVPDSNQFLNRDLSSYPFPPQKTYFPLYIVLILAFSACLIKQRKFVILASWLFFLTLGFGLVLRAHIDHGWSIFYGPVFSNIIRIQTLFTVFSLLIIWGMSSLISKLKIKRVDEKYLFFIPLSFAIDPIIESLRFTVLDGRNLIGFMPNSFHFIGVATNPLGFVNQIFPYQTAGALLQITPYKIIGGFWRYEFINILGHLGLALILGAFYYVLPGRAKRVYLIILISLFILGLIGILSQDPTFVSSTVR